MLNPVIFVSRAILVALAATFLIVALKVIVGLLGVDHIINELVIGLIFAAGMAFAGARYGHPHAKRSTSSRILEIRLFLLQFALFLFILSGLQFNLGEVLVAGHLMPVSMIIIPVLVVVWLTYWCWKNVLNISEEQANMMGTKRTELLTLCAGLMFAPLLLLVPGFALADVFGFDPVLILAVFQFAPIMSASLPIAYSLRKMMASRED